MKPAPMRALAVRPPSRASVRRRVAARNRSFAALTPFGRDLFLAENILPARGRPVACPFPGVAVLPVLREAPMPPGPFQPYGRTAP